ncbi:MAG: hypothetical protein ACKVIA_07865, partial [Rhodobacterales bacterium]
NTCCIWIWISSKALHFFVLRACCQKNEFTLCAYSVVKLSNFPGGIHLESWPSGFVTPLFQCGFGLRLVLRTF